MQQSTVWWTRRDHKGPTKYGGGTNWFETYQSRGINNEEERGYEPRVDKNNMRICYNLHYQYVG